MLTRLLPRDISNYQDVINEAINQTIPNYQEKLRTKLYEELLLGLAQVWIFTSVETFNGLIITKIEEDISAGGKRLNLVVGYFPEGIEGQFQTVANAYDNMSKFARSHGCDRISVFTNHPKVVEYFQSYNVLWQTKYFEISLSKEN